MPLKQDDTDQCAPHMARVYQIATGVGEKSSPHDKTVRLIISGVEVLDTYTLGVGLGKAGEAHCRGAGDKHKGRQVEQSLQHEPSITGAGDYPSSRGIDSGVPVCDDTVQYYPVEPQQHQALNVSMGGVGYTRAPIRYYVVTIVR